MAGTVLTYPDWRWGMQLTAPRLTGRQPNKVVKTARETVTSSTAYQNDDELRFPVEANARYFAMFVYGADGVTGADIKTAYTVPTGATGLKYCMGPQVGDADRENTNMVNAVHGFATDRPYGTVAATNSAITIREYLHILTGGTAGEVILIWAQNTSNATATAIVDNSYLMWWRVG